MSTAGETLQLQARAYLEAAKWGLDGLLEEKFSGYGFNFYITGIMASLRAVQHVLDSHDRHLSAKHKQVIDDWWKETSSFNSPELQFIKRSRDLILKKGAFEGYATYTESAIGEGDNRQVTNVAYDLAWYDDDGKRHDLLADLRRAIDWCERELAAIEAKLPPL
jgi:hypothetical protein